MRQKKLVYYGLPLIGTIFCLWYIKEATFDIVYSDYIRIVNKYLPDIWSRENFFRPDILTRIPINYLARIVNVLFFDFSTTFDMALGALSLGLSALVLGWYCEKKDVSLWWYGFLMFLLFGLNKWEMLTNGTGWAHFLAFACFYYHYLVFDRVLYGQGKLKDPMVLLALPPIITLGIAGPYCAVYSVVMILAYGSAWLAGGRTWDAGNVGQTRDGKRHVADVEQAKGEKRHEANVEQAKGKAATAPYMSRKLCLAGIVSVVIPLLLYVWSNSYAYEDHDGAIKITIGEMFSQRPEFFPNFLLKSLASMVVGEETINELVEIGIFSNTTVYLLGAFLAAGYLLALYLNLRERLYQQTLVPLMLLFAGMGNHGIILISRYIFGREEYGMSSRYALQYQAGILGIILTFALVRNIIYKKKLVMAAASVLCVMLLAGHGYTNYRELEKAPWRELYGENIGHAALQYEILSDDEVRTTFDYREGREQSSADVRRALRILKENGWNIFGRISGKE